MAGPRATWASKVDRTEAALREAIQLGLAEAAGAYAQRVSNRLWQGYTSGDFVTGNVASKVEVTPVTRTADGYEVKVGSSVDYAAHWELGHINIFTARFTATSSEFFEQGGYQRVEIWRPYLIEMRDVIWEILRRRQVAAINKLAGRASEPQPDVNVVNGQVYGPNMAKPHSGLLNT